MVKKIENSLELVGLLLGVGFASAGVYYLAVKGVMWVIDANNAATVANNLAISKNLVSVVQDDTVMRSVLDSKKLVKMLTRHVSINEGRATMIANQFPKYADVFPQPPKLKGITENDIIVYWYELLICDFIHRYNLVTVWLCEHLGSGGYIGAAQHKLSFE
jgi:hypothetical protein